MKKINITVFAALTAFIFIASMGCSKSSNGNSNVDGDFADFAEADESVSVDYEWNPEWENNLEESANETQQEEQPAEEPDNASDEEIISPDGDDDVLSEDDGYEKDAYEDDAKDDPAADEEPATESDREEEPVVEAEPDKEPEADAEQDGEVRRWKSCSICRDDQDCADLYHTDIYECYNYYCAVKNCADDEECQAKSGYPEYSRCVAYYGRRVCTMCRNDQDCADMYGSTAYVCGEYFCRVRDCVSNEECAAKSGYPEFSQCVEYYDQKVCTLCRNNQDCADLYNSDIYVCYEYYCREKECVSDDECRAKTGYPSYSRCVEM